MKMAVKKRSEIPQEHKWRIEDLFATNELWHQEFDFCMDNTHIFEEFRGHLGESPEILHRCLDMYDSIFLRADKTFVYALLRFYEDSTNVTYQGLRDKAQNMVTKLSAGASFIHPEILTIDDAVLSEWLQAYQPLMMYTHFIQDLLRQKAHILSPEIEELLANAMEVGNAATDIFTMLNNADMKFADVTDRESNTMQLTHGNYINLMESPDRTLRKNAFESLYDSYMKQKNTLAATTNANVKKDVFFAQTRNYTSVLDSALSSDNIPVDVYSSLIDTVHEHLPLTHRYVALRKKRLELDELHMYDLYTPIVKNANTSITYREAQDTVIKSLAPMGKEYVNILSKGFDSGWVDIYENIGKRSGAFSWGVYGCHPYVHLNFTDTIDNMFTLTHEMGHAMHSYYSWSAQPYIYSGYSIFLAEVASTVNEAILTDYLLKTTGDKTQREYIINYSLEQFRGTLFRQTMFAEFEMITHEMTEAGQPLTLDALCEIYRQLNIKYYGPDIVVDNLIDIEWARIPHFYSSFYVYKYATGFSAATALSKKILTEGETAVESYKGILKAGSNGYPIDILANAGVNMRTSQPVKDALSVFGEYLKEMESLS